jgi:hypothetical protein
MALYLLVRGLAITPQNNLFTVISRRLNVRAVIVKKQGMNNCMACKGNRCYMYILLSSGVARTWILEAQNLGSPHIRSEFGVAVN